MGTGGLEGPTLLTVVGLVGTFVSTIALGSWKARGIQAKLEQKIGKRAEELKSEFFNVREEARKETGDGLAALRQKATDMELWNRDNFVRRSDFQNAVDGFTRSIDNLRADIKNDRVEIKEEYARLSDKLDEVIKGKVGPAPHR